MYECCMLQQQKTEQTNKNATIVCDYRWYHGSLSRSEATRLLQKEKEGGVFLVRDSTTIKVIIMIMTMVRGK